MFKADLKEFEPMQDSKITERDLKGYNALVCELKREQEKYAELKASLDGKGVRYDREPIGAGIGKPTESQALRLANCGSRIKWLNKEVARIEQGVDAIEDANIRVAVKYIYYDGLSLSRTAKILKKNRNALARAIKMLFK